ncbi:MAG: polysaccharide deacetylase family protein [Rhodospirillales bacterium]
MTRDFIGYGATPPHPRWPGDARIAVNINLNFEGGGERTVDNGDGMSEPMLNDIGAPAYDGIRSPLVESVFEYGSRVGSWRLLRVFDRFRVKASVLAVGQAALANPVLTRAFHAAGHEIVSHGWRWIDYHLVDEATERDHILRAVEALTSVVGSRPVGWMTGRPGPNTRRLVAEEGGFLYDRDALNDELPYWVREGGRPHLVIPYSFETNDNRFDGNLGFSTADDYFTYMRDCFDTLYEEGADCPKLMSIALHDRLIGRPARIRGLVRFLEHARAHERVWFCTGAEIAAHWRAVHPPSGA